jgi:hypothetical protein
MNDAMMQRIAKCLDRAELTPEAFGELDLTAEMDKHLEHLKAEKIKKDATKAKGVS